MACNRRQFLRGLTGFGPAAFVIRPRRARAEPPLETIRLRLLKERGRTCWAPQYVAEELLNVEGFTEVTYVDFPGGAVSELLTTDPSMRSASTRLA